MKFPLKLLIYIFSITAFIITAGKYLHADIVILVDGTVIVGKVIDEDPEMIHLKNSYKLFDIEKKHIKNSFITSRYEEDIELNKKLGLKADESMIKMDFLAGLEKIVEMEKKGWSGRVSVIACYYSTLGRLRDIIPFSFGALAAYDQALYNLGFLKFASKGKDSRWFPYLRSELEYSRYEKDSAKLDKFNFAAGPIWFIHMPKKKNGAFILSGLPGVSYLMAAKNNDEDKGFTFTLNSVIGYEYSEGRSSYFIQARHVFISDKVVNLTGLGFAIGTSYKIW